MFTSPAVRPPKSARVDGGALHFASPPALVSVVNASTLRIGTGPFTASPLHNVTGRVSGELTSRPTDAHDRDDSQYPSVHVFTAAPVLPEAPKGAPIKIEKGAPLLFVYSIEADMYHAFLPNRTYTINDNGAAKTALETALGISTNTNLKRAVMAFATEPLVLYPGKKTATTQGIRKTDRRAPSHANVISLHTMDTMEHFACAMEHMVNMAVKVDKGYSAGMPVFAGIQTAHDTTKKELHFRLDVIPSNTITTLPDGFVPLRIGTLITPATKMFNGMTTRVALAGQPLNFSLA